MSMRFPDFFLIGAPKCGTTSLFEWLSHHRDIYLPVKEPNFLSADVLDVRNYPGAMVTEAQYLARLCPPEAAGMLTGEATPKYLYSENALARLAREAERVRLIVLLRNPVELAFAMHAQSVREGYERETNFAKAWTRGPIKPADRMTDYRFWGRPGIWLQKYLSTFPRDRILVMLLEEEMSQNPSAAHAQTLRFLDLPVQRLNDYTVRNPSKVSRYPYIQGLSRRTWRTVHGALDKVGVRHRGTGLLKVLDRLNQNRPGKVILPPTLRTQIAEELADDAKLIASLLRRDGLPWEDFNLELHPASRIDET